MSKIISYEKVSIIENALKTYFGNGGFKVVEDSMAYSLFAGGKRIRPLIAIEVFELFGGKNIEKVLPFAVSLEMIHTYSLIHDDLPCMDDDNLRRGKPTNHVVYGYANALLAGDGLLNLAFETMLENIKDEKGLNASKYIAKCSGRKGMISGQSADLYFENNKATVENMQYIHINKTGALLTASFMVGAIMGGASLKELNLIEELGNFYGQIFQLTDDLLDKYGSSEQLGKSIGKDEKTFKSSALYILGERGTKVEIDNLMGRCIDIMDKLNIEKNNFLRTLLNDTVERSN